MKKRCVCLILVCLTPICTEAQNIDLDFMRLNYGKVVSDKELCSILIEELKTEKNNPVFLAYYGALQTIWANHTLNPISKLSTFNKGKKNLEKAVEMASDDIEIRFIRLSVQKNAPTFLGYHQHIEADEAFIEKHKHAVTSASLLQLINVK